MAYSSSVNFPEEIIEEVLSRVPVIGLLKFRCVSKSWLRLIDSEQFKKAQLENSRKNTGFLEHRLIACHYHYRLYQSRLQSLLNGKYLHPIHELYGFNVVGSFNGLVCLEKDFKHFIMWNPSTRIINKLPDIDRVAANHTMRVRNCGMGWLESSGEYKIFAVAPDFQAKIYSSKTNSWKTVRLEDSNMDDVYQRVGHFVSGKLHWLMMSRVVVSFDLTSEVFELIELPFTPKSWRYPWLGVLGGYLCALYDRSYYDRSYDTRGDVDVLVMIMKEYGVKESWQKLEPPFPASAQFAQQQNGDLLLFFGNDFFVYSPKENVFHYPRDRLSHYARPLLCIDTLVSPILHH